MKSNYKKLPGSKIELEVALDQNEFKSYWDVAHEHALSQVQLKGFRPGSAPKALAEQTVDKDKVFEEAVKAAVRFTLDELSQDNNWMIIDTPKIELKENPTGLVYTAALTVFPEVQLGNYQKIAKKIFSERRPISVDEKEIDRSLEWLKGSRAKIVRVNREAHAGDVVEINLESAVEIKPLDNFSGERFVLGQSHFLAGFDKELENHKEGEDLNFSIIAPADYWKEDLRGKKIDFKARLNAVFERQLPEVNDEFAKAVGKFNSVAELKTSVSEGIKVEKDQKERDRLRLKFLEELGKSSKIDAPEMMIEKTLEKMEENFRSMIASGKMTEAELKEKLRPRAKNNVETNLLLYKIAEIEKIDYDSKRGVDNEKIFEYLESLVAKP